MNPEAPLYPCKDYPFNGMTQAERGRCGITIRDYIAIEAMKGLISNSTIFSLMGDGRKEKLRSVCEASYEFADALIAESNKNNVR